jgi:hypothetical protein
LWQRKKEETPMARNLIKIKELKEHIAGVRDRAGHHAQNVIDIVVPMLGAIVWRAESIKAREYDGHLVNETRFTTVSGQEYTIGYDHSSESVQVKRGGMNGTLLTSFTDASTLKQVVTFFESLP